jgi:hypothetical protein
MRWNRNFIVLGFSIGIALAASNGTFNGLAEDPVRSGLTDAEKEEFLLKAKVVRKRSLSVGVTGTHRLTMTDGTSTYDAHLQTIDQTKPYFQGDAGTEVNFRDSYKYNVAAYRLDRMINLNMVPVSVLRKVEGRNASVTWWVEDVQMMERDRHQRKMQAPDTDWWNYQMYRIRVFNELVYNMDANLTNLLITNDWRIVPIDFTRAFRRHTTIKTPANLTKIDRTLLEGLKQLDVKEVERQLGPCLIKAEIQGLMARRDKIVEHFTKLASQHGDDVVFMDPPTP